MFDTRPTDTNDLSSWHALLDSAAVFLEKMATPINITIRSATSLDESEIALLSGDPRWLNAEPDHVEVPKRRFLQRLFGRSKAPSRRVSAGFEVEEAAAIETGESLFEIEVVGESHYQDALAGIAGPKEPDGKHVPVGVTLRCEADNPKDPNAVRVEVMGQLVGYSPKEHAIELSSALRRACRGVLEARGLIVGGWRDGDDEGHYGIRVWLTGTDIARLNIDSAIFEPPGHEVREPESTPWPVFPVGRDELRLTPSSERALRTNVTVVNEEYYQETILASRPSPWNRGSWPLLVGLDLAPNPHSTGGHTSVRVVIDNRPAGYFTPAMSERHRAQIEKALASGVRPTAIADAHQGEKAKTTIWRLKVALEMPADTPVTFVPARIVSIRTGISHNLGEQLLDGSWRARCGIVIPSAEARILAHSRPFGRIVDHATKRDVDVSGYSRCQQC